MCTIHSYKKVRLLVVTLLASIFLSAQQCPVKEIARVDLPQPTKALSYEILQGIIERDKENEMFLKPMLLNRNDEHYKIDSFLLNLSAAHFNAPKNYLESIKKNYETWCRFGKGDTCRWPMEIMTVNNYGVFIVNTDFGAHGGNYFFFTVNKKHNATLNGRLYYYGADKSSRIKCRAALDDLLDNIAYKL